MRKVASAYYKETLKLQMSKHVALQNFSKIHPKVLQYLLYKITAKEATIKTLSIVTKMAKVTIILHLLVRCNVEKSSLDDRIGLYAAALPRKDKCEGRWSLPLQDKGSPPIPLRLYTLPTN